MVARARKPGESYETYRKNLRREAIDEKIRLGTRRMRHISISYVFDTLRRLFMRAPGKTYDTMQNAQKRARPSKAERKRMRRAQHRQ